MAEAEAAGARRGSYEYHDSLFEQQREESGLDSAAARDWPSAWPEQVGLGRRAFHH